MKKVAKGKIGVFDSGLGGLTILKAIVKLMPEREYIYLGDNLRAPYGGKSQAEIFKYTLAGVEWLFNQGAEIVILACNTASSNSLKRIQQEVLPIKYPKKKLLGIIIPTAEEVKGYSQSGHIGILATEATVLSGAFDLEIKKRGQAINVVCQTGGKLVELIEKNENESIVLSEIKRVIGELIDRDGLIDVILLGCTHYALIADQIVGILPKNIKAIGQADLVAIKLSDYLERHKDVRDRLSSLSAVQFYTTNDSDQVKNLMKKFYATDIPISLASYSVA